MKELIILLIVFSNIVIYASKSEVVDLNSIFKTNWTHTYLKATDGKAELMKEYIINNWFVMDEIAVKQGLFRDYRLIINQQPENNASWDLIVAVEYYGNESYTDIAKGFEAIRESHQEYTVDGLNRGDFKVVRSELISVYDKFRQPLKCPIEHYQILKPFLGFWEYIDTSTENEDTYGMMEFRINSFDCSTIKQARFYQSGSGYLSKADYDTNENIWTESYSTGAEFQWRMVSGETYMYNMSSQLPTNQVRRNQWQLVGQDEFKILEQFSNDNGASWETKSTTVLRRR